MTDNIPWEMILGVITIITFVGGVWRRLEGKIKEAEQAATLRALSAQTKSEVTEKELAAYKLHVAETYASKTSVNAQFDAVTKSITDVGARMETRLDGMNERLDRVIEAGQKPTSSRRTSN